MKDFGTGGSNPNGADVLDLSALLQGEENSTNLSQYLRFSKDGTNTVITISTTGDLQTSGNTTTGFDQVITLENVNLIGNMTDQNQIIQTLMEQGKLKLDT